MFVGIYNYTVVITYLSLVSAGLGMFFASRGQFKAALFCLLLSGLCDMIDGPVARTRKRNDTEKKFGIQIDSLCDCISFGIQPAVLVYFIACGYGEGSEALQIIALCVGLAFALCAVIRLAYFNVTEEERQEKEGAKKRTGYQGLPVTNSALIIPALYNARYFTDGKVFAIIMTVGLGIIAFLYVFNFKMFKLHGKKLIPVGIIGVLILVGCFLTP
ncbi:MAG: CDP-alcohol phosphatidyltransferase family protein [Lachnospiraceae bacterium]|nr:CDP-alcohol phosphatidyltransferase family protein [Lachnospiraceae bacterium]